MAIVPASRIPAVIFRMVFMVW
jgi:hypothetical protein